MGWTEDDFLLSSGGYQASDKRNVLENEGYFMLANTFKDKVVIVTGVVPKVLAGASPMSSVLREL